MLEQTAPDSVQNSFRSEDAQESGQIQSTSQNCTIETLSNQEADAVAPVRTPKPRKPPGKFAGTGNRSGHIPELLRGANLKNEARRPVIIQQLIKASEKLYERPRGSKKGHGEFIQVRSEGRESVVQYIQKIVYNLELSTMTVCWEDIHFSRPTLKEMTSDADQTGLSYTRAKRAQKKLEAEGYVRVARSPKYKRGEFRADPSVREVTPKLFKLLGRSQEYSFQQHYKTKRLEKRGIKQGFKKEILDKLKERLANGDKNKDGVKTGSFPEKTAHRENLINLYVDVCRMKGSEMSAALMRSVAVKMSTETLESLLKYHTSDTS